MVAASLLVFAPALMPNDSLDRADRSSASRALDSALPQRPAPAAPGPSEDVGIDGVDVPDPLVLDGGGAIDSVQVWESQRRPELLDAFEENVYGQSLPVPAPEDLAFDEDGAGSARTTTVTVTGPEGEASFTVRLFVPDGTPKGTFLLIDHRGSVGDDAGSSSGYAPVSTILDAGYAFAALDAGEIAPDDSGSYRDGVIDAFYPSGTDLPDDAGRTISAWAWGASRALDYLETVPGIDAGNVAVIGHSRGGKAALWAGAQDTRFPVVISNNSGSTGAKLARRDGAGESISAINEQFPHWFPETYKSYNDDPDSLPVDQHQLLALIAPGRVVIGSASDDGNADPQGEYMSYLAAAPVYELYGLSDTGLASQSWPPTTDQAFRGPGMSYHLRSGGHGLEDADWGIYLEGDLFRR
ncbi:alpha/beta hydrolase [Pseudonocardia sp. EC080610-09]|uniref:glucuronyl esterase domain-containing protein n=1 Tax=Pseudonocardia sp. EC080610-09 TaxID=1688404 RepID=UPI000760DF0D|nr:alpha/beta hydrolase [Pseudonocardia sp. EC080610-09]